jgi:hypothetical protein
MGDVIQLFRDAAFDPETVELLGSAYDIARRALRDTGQPSTVNEVVAFQIIKQAGQGERDPHALAAGALQAFGLHYLP